jgi:hypothetical protein
MGNQGRKISVMKLRFCRMEIFQPLSLVPASANRNVIVQRSEESDSVITIAGGREQKRIRTSSKEERR